MGCLDQQTYSIGKGMDPLGVNNHGDRRCSEDRIVFDPFQMAYKWI